MTRIAIKDLTESVALDHAAMDAITGGARIARSHGGQLPQQAPRMVQFPWDTGFAMPGCQDSKGALRDK